MVRGLLVSAILLAACIAIGCGTNTPQQATAIKIGNSTTSSVQIARRAFPRRVSGGELRNEISARKGKLVLLNLWALW